jgi:hypothetical protein
MRSLESPRTLTFKIEKRLHAITMLNTSQFLWGKSVHCGFLKAVYSENCGGSKIASIVGCLLWAVALSIIFIF